ncbi:MAG: GNAT family N-acetyltransferase, partial [Acidobacteriota bacterium]|nr:GNAT family N-acetyltransferase [Acidobacteriota bacterium]
MKLQWIHEEPAQWDADKQRLIGDAAEGIFAMAPQSPGELVAGEWWRVEADGKTVGFGWLDTVWGDAEVLLAVDPESRRGGVGSFIMEQLALEAHGRQLNYLYNVVRPTHPDRESLRNWLIQRGFKPSSEDD